MITNSSAKGINCGELRECEPSVLVPTLNHLSWMPVRGGVVDSKTGMGGRGMKNITNFPSWSYFSLLSLFRGWLKHSLGGGRLLMEQRSCTISPFWSVQSAVTFGGRISFSYRNLLLQNKTLCERAAGLQYTTLEAAVSDHSSVLVIYG